jgi:FkbM family methyltransferase
MLHELGYLDEDHYPLEASDHDLFMRAWNDRAWRCGFVPVEFYNPQSWGSTRKVRNDGKTKYLNMRESKIKYGYFSQHSTTFKYPDAEIRQMEWNDIARVRDIITKTTSPIIVQLGTNNGKDDVNMFVKSLKSPFVVLCEPFNIHNSSINDNYKGINAYIENIAIVPVKNQSAVNIYFADRDGASPEHPSYEVTSMLPSHLIKHGYSQDELKSFRVECKTLSELFDKYKLENIDYLFIDIEGCDFDVIRSINFSKYTIKNIQVEYIHLNKDELISFMTSKGYSIGDPIGNSNYDIMFTREKIDIFWLRNPQVI